MGKFELLLVLACFSLFAISVMMGAVSLGRRKRAGFIWGVGLFIASLRMGLGLWAARQAPSWPVQSIGASLSLFASCAFALGSFAYLGNKAPKLFYPSIFLCLLWIIAGASYGLDRPLVMLAPWALAAAWLGVALSIISPQKNTGAYSP